MKTRLLRWLSVGCALGVTLPDLAQTNIASPSLVTNAAQPVAAVPRIQFAGTEFDFGKLNSGEVVKHSFVFTNIGTATLEIKDVRPSCGCTAAGLWDKLVEPGKTGSIPLQFNSTGFGGAVAKVATVICNDPAQTNVQLQMKGTVWKPIEVTPTVVMFNATREFQTNETKIVRIVNNEAEPLELSDLQSTNRVFRAELQSVRPGKEFELHITTVPPFPPGTIAGDVALKTSSLGMPAIHVLAYVFVQDPVTVSPRQILLPPGPLPAAMSLTVAIRNNRSDALSLSDANVNFSGAEVRLKESQPGSLFSLMLTLPAGFEVKPEQTVELSVKCNHPNYPAIKVPILHAPAEPAAFAQPPAVTNQGAARPVMAVPARARMPEGK